jgi:phenylalanyl-tRNA synthetase beta chain
MKVSLRWLADYIDLPTQDPGELRTALAALGHEVEGVEILGADWAGVVVAEVLTVEPHPNADKVRLCSVTTGGDPIAVVCGAWNFDAGAIVPFAVPGAVLPGGFEIGRREIRGVQSNGMICSERELGLGDDHAGILVLEPDAPVGVDFTEYIELPDVVFDLAITPNRPDAMSMIGIARDLGAFYGVPYRMPSLDTVTVAGSPSTTVSIEDPSGCLRFTGREVRGITVGPSPLWMRRRLRAAGMRPISNAVDVTNYVMLELGHPLHAFDADRIVGDRLVVRRATAGEKLVTLDDMERTLAVDDLVIVDDSGPTSMAGTMGGASSEVSDATHRVFMEAATWDPPTIMWMSRRHLLPSEASKRFERGVDPMLPLTASARACKLLVEIGGGELLEGVLDVVAVEPRILELSLPVSEVARTLGEGFDSERITRLLSSIEMEVSGDDPLAVGVPSFRPDITRPIDLIEELARLAGYDSFGDTVPTGPAGGLTVDQRRTRSLRAALRGAGLSQAVHLSFIGADDLDAFAYPADHEARAVVTVLNPLREEESKLRTSLLPALLSSLRYNRAHGARSVALFETGKVFFARPDADDTRIPDQPDRVAFAIAGRFGPVELDGSARSADVFTATALWKVIARSLQLSGTTLRPAARPGFHPGRCAEVLLGDAVVGVVGEIHPNTAAAYDLEGRVAAGELDLAPLVAASPTPLLVTPSTFPPVEFDLAFLVAIEVPAARLVDVTRSAGGEVVVAARVFDEYTGRDDGRKSLAVRYELRASDRTLTSEEVAPIRRSMVEAAVAIGAELRGEL